VARVTAILDTGLYFKVLEFILGLHIPRHQCYTLNMMYLGYSTHRCIA